MKTRASALGTGESVLQIVAVELKTLGCPVKQFDEEAKERLEKCEFRHLKPVVTGGLSAVPPEFCHSFRLKLGPGANQNRSFELYRVSEDKPESVDSGSTMFIVGPSESGVYEITAESGDRGTRFEWVFKCKLSEDSATDLQVVKDCSVPSPDKAAVGPDPSNDATPLSSAGDSITTTTATGGNNKPKAQPTQPNGRNGNSMEHKLVRWLADAFCDRFQADRQAFASGAKGEATTAARRATVFVARRLKLSSSEIATVEGLPIPGNVSTMLKRAEQDYGKGVSDFANKVKKVMTEIPPDLRPNGGEGAAVEAGASSLATPTPEKPRRRPYTRRVAKVGAAVPLEMVRNGHGNDDMTKTGRDLLIFLMIQSNGSTTTDIASMFGATETEVEQAFGHFALAARGGDSKISQLAAMFKEVVGQ